MNTTEQTSGYLLGHCLIAMPSMGDVRFDRSVVYLCAHSPEGAMGIVVNRVVDQISFTDLLKQLDVASTEYCENIKVHFGGPVESGRGFVLHSTDYVQETTMLINQKVALTATVDILRDIAINQGPRSSMLALGYAGWSPGQLEEELKNNAWLTVKADEELLFETENDNKWKRALEKIGVEPSKLSDVVGTA